MTGATIPRPDPVPTCVRYDGEAGQPCPETAVGVDCDGPACAKHMCGEPLCNKRSLYAPAAPAPVEAPGGQPEDKPGKRGCPRNFLCALPPGHAGNCDEREPAPVAIGVVAEARRLLRATGEIQSFDAQVELWALALDRAYQTGHADALLTAHQVWAETISKVVAASVLAAREGK